MFKRKTKTEKRKPTTEIFKQPQPMHSDVTIYSVAIILDGEVQDIIRTEARLAAMLLSDPTFVDITEIENKPGIGVKYDIEKGEFEHSHEKNNI